MIYVRINEQQYQVCQLWRDLSIELAGKIAVEPIPDSLKRYYDLSTMEDGEEKTQAWGRFELETTPEERFKEWGAYYGRIIQLCSDIPAEVIEKIDAISRDTLYQSYLRRFVLGLLYFPADYQAKEITSFELSGVTYHLPESRIVLGQAVPMAKAQAIEFTESADLMANLARVSQKDYSRLANIAAILCRPKGEPYEEEVCLDRARQFLELPMSIAWDVFFSLIGQQSISELQSLTSLQAQEKEGKAEKGQSSLQSSAGTGKYSLQQEEIFQESST
jgi:hypothetical protein